ncbi:MAG: hypothetical protein WAU47_13790 [Desulfobaccales bacterium]
MAGDRWQVILEVRLPIPVTKATLPPDLVERAPEVLAALGPKIVFTQEDVRHFIDVHEVPGVLQEMQARFVEGLGAYVSRPDFPGRFIRKKFIEHQKENKL